MVKYEIARWVTPELGVERLVFTTFGGSAHGMVSLEIQDIESGEWSRVEHISRANGIPTTKGEKVSSEHINQFTGDTVRDE